MPSHSPSKVPAEPYHTYGAVDSSPTDRSLSPDLSAMFSKDFLKSPRATVKSPRAKRKAPLSAHMQVPSFATSTHISPAFLAASSFSFSSVFLCISFLLLSYLSRFVLLLLLTCVLSFVFLLFASRFCFLLLLFFLLCLPCFFFHLLCLSCFLCLFLTCCVFSSSGASSMESFPQGRSCKGRGGGGKGRQGHGPAGEPAGAEAALHDSPAAGVSCHHILCKPVIVHISELQVLLHDTPILLISALFVTVWPLLLVDKMSRARHARVCCQ